MFFTGFDDLLGAVGLRLRISPYVSSNTEDTTGYIKDNIVFEMEVE